MTTRMVPAFIFLLVYHITAAQIIVTGADTTSRAGRIFYSAARREFQYTGRIQFSNTRLPRFWQPGVYIQARFKGTACDIFIYDEMLWGNSHNYIQVVIDNKKPLRIKTLDKRNTIRLNHLADGVHTITICKGTEAGIGYIEFAGMACRQLLSPLPKPARKIEFIGNSITSGMGSDFLEIPCDKAQWYDQHNAWDSYGVRTARALHAQWQLSSVSGIGLIHSCCNMTVTMPRVFDKINMRDDSLAWEFSHYIPDVVTICLGQNDGVQDSVTFCEAYEKFISDVRTRYPNAVIFCLTSPMGDDTLTAALRKYLAAIVRHKNISGDEKVYAYVFKKRYHAGCGGHPSLQEHQQIATELTAYIRKVMKW